MTGRFAVLKGGELIEVSRLEDLPATFDNLIAFVPDVPLPPHTDEEHAFLESLNGVLKGLLARENRDAGRD